MPEESSNSSAYSDAEVSCLKKIKDPVWRAINNIRPPYKAHEKYLDFLAERIDNKATVDSFNKMIDYAVVTHKMELAEHIFDDLLKCELNPNTETFNSMILGYMQNCDVDKAIKYFSQMPKHGVPPNLSTYGNMMHGLMDNSQFDQACKLLSPAKLQYSLLDEISFAALQYEFMQDNTLNVRNWLCRFLPDSAKKSVFVELVERIESKGAKKDGRFNTTHPSESNIVYTFEGKQHKIPIKPLFKQHVGQSFTKKHEKAFNDCLPLEVQIDADGLPLESSVIDLLQDIKLEYERSFLKKKKKRKEKTLL